LRAIARARARNYTESFAYALQTDLIKEDLQPNKYVTLAAKAYQEVKQLVDECIVTQQTKQLNQVLDALQQIAWGNFAQPAFLKQKDWYQDLATLTKSYAVSNLLSDLRKYAEFFDPQDFKKAGTPQRSAQPASAKVRPCFSHFQTKPELTQKLEHTAKSKANHGARICSIWNTFQCSTRSRSNPARHQLTAGITQSVMLWPRRDQ
jgi:hypothetical protein